MEEAPRRSSQDSTTCSKRVSRRVKRRSSRIDEESEIVSFHAADDFDDDDDVVVRTKQRNRSRRPKIPDPFPRRLTNPLVDDSKVTTMEDLVKITDEISFHRADTYSIHYLARVLGVNSILDEVADNHVVGIDRLLERLKQPVNLYDPDIYRIPDRQVFSRVFSTDDDRKCLDGKWEPVYHKLLNNRVIQTVPMSDPQIQKCLKIVNGVPQNANAIRNAILPLFDAESVWMKNITYLPYEAAPFEIANASSTLSGWMTVDAVQAKISDAMVFQLEWFENNPLLRLLVASANPVLNCLLWQQAKMAEINYAMASEEGIPALRSVKTLSGSYVGDFRKTSPYLIQFYRPETTEPPSRHRIIARLPPANQTTTKHQPMMFSNTKNTKPTKEVRIRVNVERGEIEGYDDSKVPAKDASLSILRHFTLPSAEPTNDDEVTMELIKNQNELRSLEGSIDPVVRGLFTKVVEDRIAFEHPTFHDREAEEELIMEKTKDMVEERKKTAQEMEEQISMDMEAVCNICVDGDITPGNQIIFCDSCNVPVHQMCYGIESIPSGDYYCVACRNLGRDKHTRQPLSIRCELCPLPGGAFVKTATSGHAQRWVHVVCAKWSGLEYIDRGKWETIEDVTQMRINFRRLRIRCELCLGERGAMIKCTGQAHCKKWFHVTCARASGKMLVTHGENCHGSIGANGWTLSCPAHTKVPIEQKNIIPVETMIKYAKELPPEPVPPPEPRPFNELNGSDRNALLADPKYEHALISDLLQKRFFGVRCEICDSVEDEKQNRCAVCSAVFCSGCRMESDDVKKSTFKCVSCLAAEASVKEGGNGIEVPKCFACVQRSGPLRPAFANPRTRQEYWKKHEKERLRSYFGKQFWVHSLCAFWLPGEYMYVSNESGEVDVTNAILSDGKGMVTSNSMCFVCGITIGVKAKCSMPDCCVPDNGTSTMMHVSCARQAGLEVGESDNEGFIVHCYRHCGNEFNLRAKLEDMVEIEKRRAGKDLAKFDTPMSFADASRILHSAIYVMRVLGWAWRWAEWWVDFNSSWEPLLEPGQKEEEMTKEELKIVESTRQQRCDDARRCRLAAFGAALRNREYDIGDDFQRDALDKALRAILHTKSLVGPMTSREIDFYVEWLGRAYRSKSRLLFMGESKSRVSLKSPFCVHAADGSLKYELGSRPLPGTLACVDDSVFEAKVDEPDNYMLISDEVLEQHRSKSIIPVVRKRTAGSSQNHPKKVGRPRKSETSLKAQSPTTPSTDSGRSLRSRTPETNLTKRGRATKKRSLEESRSPKQASEDYLTRHFKARQGRRATIEARTSTAATNERSVSPPPGKRRGVGRPPGKKKKEETGGNTEEDVKQPESSQQDVATDEEKPAASNVTQPEADDKPVGDETSFDVVKHRNRKRTRQLKVGETSGKSYDSATDSTTSSTLRRRR